MAKHLLLTKSFDGKWVKPTKQRPSVIDGIKWWIKYYVTLQHIGVDKFWEILCTNCQCWPNKAVEWVILFRLTSSRYCSKNMIYSLSCQTVHPEQKDSILPVSAFRGGANILKYKCVRASVANYRNCWFSSLS